MPRSPRIDLPGVPQHLLTRGNDRGACFFRDQDRRIYLRYLADAAQDFGCGIHSFVLMTNHVHLLATGRSPRAISKMMHMVGTRFARYINRGRGRTGSLHEGRFKSSLVQTERYFLTCMRYIELNPVRAGLVSAPQQYEWSSFAENATGEPGGWLEAHPEYLRLGKTARARGQAYRELFAAPLDDADLAAIRDHTRTCRALGSDSFRAGLEATLRRPVGMAPHGRPRKINLSPFSSES